MKKPKTFRGQHKIQWYRGCYCHYCTGYSKGELLLIKEKEIDKQTKTDLEYETIKANGESL